jgi:hypothetical protein
MDEEDSGQHIGGCFAVDTVYEPVLRIATSRNRGFGCLEGMPVPLHPNKSRKIKEQY